MSNTQVRNSSRYDLEDRLIDFAAEICRLIDHFPATAIARHVGGQLMRSATSPFANHGEPQGAESRQDFLQARHECGELVAIFVTSIRTASEKCKMSNVE